MFLFVMGFYGLYSFGIVLIACELGQIACNAFEGICKRIETFDWYLFPCRIQRMLPMILIIAQQPTEFRCFGSVSLLREYFKKVSFWLCIARCFSHIGLISVLFKMSAQKFKMLSNQSSLWKWVLVDCQAVVSVGRNPMIWQCAGLRCGLWPTAFGSRSRTGGSSEQSIGPIQAHFQNTNT